jgi:alpha-L-rhamnosidase
LTFYGFRYIRVDEFPGGPRQAKPENFKAIVVHSDIKRTGYVSCSNPLLNQLFSNVIWGQKDNFLDVPTDCPQRDERMGWTGDAQVFCKTASYNMDTYAFYTKFLHDLWREQQKNHGMVSHVVPSFLRESFRESAFWHGGACVWGDAAVIMPWTLYNQYGDITILKRQYASMKAWIDWIVKTYVDEDGLWSGGFQFGDWLALDGHEKDDRYGGTDRTYIASMYLRYCSGMVADAAHELMKAAAKATEPMSCGENAVKNIEQLRKRRITIARSANAPKQLCRKHTLPQMAVVPSGPRRPKSWH